MTIEELQSLRTEAQQLIEEVSSKRDDSEFVFMDGTADPTVKELREVASRCSAAGMNGLARDLESLATQVAVRAEPW